MGKVIPEGHETHKKLSLGLARFYIWTQISGPQPHPLSFPGHDMLLTETGQFRGKKKKSHRG